MPPVENKEQKIVDVSIFHRQMAGIVIGSNDGGANMALKGKTT